MVQDSSSSSDDAPAHVSARVPDTPAVGIPPGRYRLVGWAVDTTGRRLIDEIVQIAGYTPDSQFAQHIMPFADLNPIYSRRHNIRVFNMIRYRRLKDMRTGLFLKTKSEISALTDFVQWLETAKGDADGVVLVFYEVRKSSPGMLLEALRRNGLLERFEKVCKGFGNGYQVAKAKCQSTTKTHNLRVMGKVLLGRDKTDFSSAAERACAIYDIVAHLAQGEREEIDNAEKVTTGAEPELVQLVCPYTNPISAEEKEIEVFKLLLQVQNTFRPVFGALMRSSASERQHASHLRRLLAENNIDYEKLKVAYEKEAKDGIDAILKKEIVNGKVEDITELLEILDCFFDPEKQAVKPKTPRTRYQQPRVPRQKSFNNNKGGRRPSKKSESKEDSASSETATPRVEEAATTAEEKTAAPAPSVPEVEAAAN